MILRMLAGLTLVVGSETGAQTIQIEDANGVLIGTWAGNSLSSGINVISPKGFIFRLEPEDGVPDNYFRPDGPPIANATGCAPGDGLVYEAQNCQGTRYFEIGQGSWIYCGQIAKRFVSAPTGIYYAPAGAVATQRNIQSRRQGSSCSNFPSTPAQTIEALPNDPNVTGIMPSYVVPVRIRSVSAACVFQNGFEICT